MLLSRSFFKRPTPDVAHDLLGKRLVHRLSDGQRIESLITETEAYHGWDDQASHAHRGQTPRNAVMFGPPGFLYLYLCYGMHWMLNISTGEAGFPAAVLIRGTTEVSGPGRLTKCFQLNGHHNGLALGTRSGIWMSDGIEPKTHEIKTGPRIGIDYAGTKWRKRHWRFIWGPGS